MYFEDEDYSKLLNNSNNSSSSYLDQIPINMRGRAEWWELKRNEIIFEKKIGEGSVGIVHKAKWRGLITACKYLKKMANETDSNDLINEISIISRLRHPNLVLFLGGCTMNEPLLLLYEYLPNGSLDYYYEKKKKELNKIWKPNNTLLYKWISQLSQAIYFLHNCHYPIMHRDIKPSNILLTSNLEIKITDFGLSKTIKNTKDNKYKMSGCAGTLRYMAPEIFINNENYDLKIDIYSLSLNFWYIYTGILPYEEIINNDNFRLHIINGYRPDKTLIKYKPLQILLINMWNTESELRPDITSVFNTINNFELKDKKKICNIL
jgi:serine/threonine protein kinase